MTLREFARLGGLARARKLSKKRRREIARKAGIAGAKARWGKRRRKSKRLATRKT